MTEIQEVDTAEAGRVPKTKQPKAEVEKAQGTPEVTVEMTAERTCEVRIGDLSSEDKLRLRDALGISQKGLIMEVVDQVIHLSTEQGLPKQRKLDFALGFIEAIEPQDEIEVALAIQMVAAHLASMQASKSFMAATSIVAKDSAERAMNKLMRTYTTQMEALKRHRSKAQQIVRVERVTVEDGGQAIVGPVSHGGRADEKK